MHLAPPSRFCAFCSADKAKEFYLAWKHRDGLILHLSEHHGDATLGSTVFARIEDIIALQNELVAKRYGYSRPEAVSVGWGLQMEIADPFGNRLRFCQQIEG
ncbi:glyoxalase superfamily protein [Pseudomonas sp. H9]|uniref:glyoxalase superfamily protein n=1 Tax=Pseudomonas sp. H9 TaxID=483968 RepID=UPI002113C452|nr:glyoxalase superfamily protein [Pseudomonas sp. H9]